jgi:hypothetical protein
VGDVRRGLLVLQGSVALVLLPRIARQLLTESTLLGARGRSTKPLHGAHDESGQYPAA